MASSRVGLLYDERMTLHHDLDTEAHPEQPLRIVRIFQRLEAEGIVDRCARIPCRRAARDELELKHTRRHVEAMLKTQALSDEEAATLGRTMNSLYLCKDSVDCALLSAGSVVEATERVCTGSVGSAICVVRPPGHHAESDCGMGFCLFGNVAIAAAEARRKGWSQRTLIVDWDVHHGNGTQRMFEEDDSVLYFSTHRYDKGSFYPGGKYGNYSSHGVGVGAGYSVNVPWDVRGGEGVGVAPPGDAEIVDAFTRVLLPICEDFKPDLVLVSAGFDCAVGDPLGGCRVTPLGFHTLTTMLMGLANGRIVIALEGGYNLESISDAMAACARALLKDPPQLVAGGDGNYHHFSSQPFHARTVKEVRSHLSRFWPKLHDAGGLEELPAEALQGGFLAMHQKLRQHAMDTGYDYEYLRGLHDNFLFCLRDVPAPPQKPVGGRRRVRAMQESFPIEEHPSAYVVPVVSASSAARAVELVGAAFDTGAHGVWLAAGSVEASGDAEAELQLLHQCFSSVRSSFSQRWVGVRPSPLIDTARVFKWLSSNCPTADAVWLLEAPCRPAEIGWETIGLQRYACRLHKWYAVEELHLLQSLKRCRENSAWLGLVFGGVAASPEFIHHEQEGPDWIPLGIGSRVEALFCGQWYVGTIVGSKDVNGHWVVQCDADAKGVLTAADDTRVIQHMGRACATLLRHWAALSTSVCDGVVTTGSSVEKLEAMALSKPLAWHVKAGAASRNSAVDAACLRHANLVFVEFGEADASELIRSDVSYWVSVLAAQALASN